MHMTDDSNEDRRPSTERRGGGCDHDVDTGDLHAVSGLTGFQRDALLVVADLAGTEPSGSHVQSRFQECLRRDVSHGSLYRNLRELHDEGYIAKVPLDGRTYSYRLTDVARTRLVSYLAWGIECLDHDRRIRRDDDAATNDGTPVGPRDVNGRIDP